MKVYALAGGLPRFNRQARPADLQADMCFPAWVDAFVDYENALDFWLDDMRSQDLVVLYGFSNGGSVIGHVTHELSNVGAAILHESPLIGIREPAPIGGPVLWLENVDGRGMRGGVRRPGPFGREMDATREAWRAACTALYDEYKPPGRHTKRVNRPRTLFVGHGYDCCLNRFIASWLASAVPKG